PPMSPASAGRGATSIRPRWMCPRRPGSTFGNKEAVVPAQGGCSMADLHAVAFPKLTEAQLDAMGRRSLTRLGPFHAQEQLFSACEQGASFFVVKSGEVEIVDESGDKPKTITIHRPGEFTGDVSQVTGTPAIVSAVARTDGEAYEISPDALRELLNNHPDLGDMIMQAFIARRQLLTAPGGFTGLRVIGSRYSRDTFRVRDF